MNPNEVKKCKFLYPCHIKDFFTTQFSPWMIEIKHPRVNENDIFIYCDINIHHVYMVWHMIDNPGHWRVVSNKGIDTIIPDHWEIFFLIYCYPYLCKFDVFFCCRSEIQQ